MFPTSSPRFFPAFIILAVALILGGLAGCVTAPPPLPRIIVEPPPPPPPPPPPETGEIDARRFAAINQGAKQEVAAGHVPGAVILVGHRGKTVYRKAFGMRALEPRALPMKVDAIFDLASLTKVVATTTAVMILVDRGQISLDKPAAAYWPAFAANGKGGITIRQLMTHTSGLRAGVASRPHWSDYDGAMEAIALDHPVRAPGTQFNYSDVNFITLGEIVRRVSHMPLNVFCKREVFEPLGMKDTSFLPSPALKSRIAPTDYQGKGLRWGVVSDPTSYHMGGVAGHAGVFSTADDLALLAQMLVQGGEVDGKRILSPATVAAMTKAQRLPGISTQRGLGWDIRSPYSRVFNSAFPKGSFGHTGYTGTAMWIDPGSQTFMIILTSRLHPNGHGNVKPLRAKTAKAVAAAVPMGPPALAVLDDAGLDPVMTGFGASDRPDRVRPGIEVLAASGFKPLAGKRIGVITNHTGIDASGRSTLQLSASGPRRQGAGHFQPGARLVRPPGREGRLREGPGDRPARL